MEIKSQFTGDIIVVIPAYNETFGLLRNTLLSLERARLCYTFDVLVLVLINTKQGDDESLVKASIDLKDKLEDANWNINVCFHYVHMSEKHAGVGLARKILMDHALRIFHQNREYGIIVNLDADSTVASDYFLKISHFFEVYPECEAASLGFRHLYDDDETREAIQAYETHLRYFINMQRLLGLPFAYQTIGSAMAVRALAYAKEGGMPKKQAGEDFYFMHKFTCKRSLGDLSDELVYPSSRISSRVPFGTGKAVSDYLYTGKSYTSYHPRHFEILDHWLSEIFAVSKFQSKALDKKERAAHQDFLKKVDFTNRLLEIRKNTSSKIAFRNRFFNWFDAFLLMKYLHFLREELNEDCDIGYCSDYLFSKLGLESRRTLEESLEQLSEVVTMKSDSFNNVV